MGAGQQKLPSELSAMENSGLPLSRIPAEGIDLAKTLNSGQVFHWTEVGRGFVGAIDQEPCYLEQSGNELLISRGRSLRFGGTWPWTIGSMKFKARSRKIPLWTQPFVTPPASEF